MENSMMISQKLKIELRYDLRIWVLCIYPKELKLGPQTDIDTLTFTELLFMIANIWRQPKCLLTHECKEIQYIHRMKYYAAFKKEEILLRATTWKNLEDIMLSEISRSQKDKYCMILFKNNRTHRSSMEWWFPGPVGRRTRELVQRV